MELIDKELRQSREDFITHFRQTYDDPYPPSWMLAEIIPLGILSRIYENISNNRIRKTIAKQFELNIPVFTSWLTIVTLTRNICCHHGRLWNRTLLLRAAVMNKPTRAWLSSNVKQGKVFFTLSILKYFVDVIFPQNTYKQDLKELLSDYPDIDLSAMGFPLNWEDEPLWH